MQEVGGSIPPGSTLRLRLRVTQPRKSPKSEACPAKPSWAKTGWRELRILFTIQTRLGSAPMWYVYIIRSINFPEQEYVGATADLKRRISDHNSGKSTHTEKFKPWELVWYCAFPDKYKALAFEKYLKSHSGRAFAKKRLQ
jgi:putative endonuclease